MRNMILVIHHFCMNKCTCNLIRNETAVDEIAQRPTPKKHATKTQSPRFEEHYRVPIFSASFPFWSTYPLS